MYKLRTSSQYGKDLKKVLRQGKNRAKIDVVIHMLLEGKNLPKKYNDHALKDSKHYKNQRECHIEPDWLLIYEIDHEEIILILTRTGSHSDLF